MPTVGRVTMSYAEMDRIMQMPAVRRRIAAVADRAAREAERIAADAGMPDLPITRTDGTRPRGRPFSRISAPLGYEYGTATMTRLAILGQAIRR